MVGQRISPSGGKKKSPAINPIVDHRVPALVPPNFLVPRCGIV